MLLSENLKRVKKIIITTEYPVHQMTRLGRLEIHNNIEQDTIRKPLLIKRETV